MSMSTRYQVEFDKYFPISHILQFIPDDFFRQVQSLSQSFRKIWKTGNICYIAHRCHAITSSSIAQKLI